jgi:TRAP-type C4-dicarboxylate transport system permease large subunit
VPLQSVFKGALPFLAALVVAALLLLAFPGIVTVPTGWVK